MDIEMHYTYKHSITIVCKMLTSSDYTVLTSYVLIIQPSDTHVEAYSQIFLVYFRYLFFMYKIYPYFLFDFI